MSTVTMLVATELLHEVDAMSVLALLNAEEISREPDRRPGYTVLTLDIPGAPAGSTSIEPVFQQTFNGSGVEVSLLDMGWR